MERLLEGLTKRGKCFWKIYAIHAMKLKLSFAFLLNNCYLKFRLPSRDEILVRHLKILGKTTYILIIML